MIWIGLSYVVCLYMWLCCCCCCCIYIYIVFLKVTIMVCACYVYCLAVLYVVFVFCFLSCVDLIGYWMWSCVDYCVHWLVVVGKTGGVYIYTLCLCGVVLLWLSPFFFDPVYVWSTLIMSSMFILCVCFVYVVLYINWLCGCSIFIMTVSFDCVIVLLCVRIVLLLCMCAYVNIDKLQI